VRVNPLKPVGPMSSRATPYEGEQGRKCLAERVANIDAIHAVIDHEDVAAGEGGSRALQPRPRLRILFRLSAATVRS
jgi:hypothetical protein